MEVYIISLILLITIWIAIYGREYLATKDKPAYYGVLVGLIGLLIFNSLQLFDFFTKIKPFLDGDGFIDEDEKITLFQLLSGIGALIGFTLIYLQLRQKDKQHNQDTQFDNFLAATKLLTAKNSTTNTKTSALYLLYDVAKTHPRNIGRILQVINRQLAPFHNLLEGDSKKRNHYKSLSQEIRTRYIKTFIDTIEYAPQDLDDNIDLDIEENFREKIKKWSYNGNPTEKVIFTALTILKRIILIIFSRTDIQDVDLSNTILFDIDLHFDRPKFRIDALIDKEKPIENLVFLHCSLKNTKFSNAIYHQGYFINCNLQDCHFSRANLFGTTFIGCNLKNVNFKDSECEGVEFKKCNNLTIDQLQKMKFENRKYFFNKIVKSVEKSVKMNKDQFYPIIINELKSDELKSMEQINITEADETDKVDLILFSFSINSQAKSYIYCLKSQDDYVNLKK